MRSDANLTLAETLAIPLVRVPTGEYELVLRFRDEVSGRSAEVREPLAVVLPSAPNADLYSEAVQTHLAGDTEGAFARLQMWPTESLAGVVRTFTKRSDESMRRAALLLHSELALRLWQEGQGNAAQAHVALGRVLLEPFAGSGLHRDFILLLAYYHQKFGFSGHAFGFYTECLRQFPNAAEAWLGLGTTHEFTAFPDGLDGDEIGESKSDATSNAIRSYREAIRLDPGLAEAHLRLGRMLQRVGQTAEAVSELGLAIQGSTQSHVVAPAHLFSGQIEEAGSNTAEAERHYRAALESDPGLQKASFALGRLLHVSGGRVAAAEALIPHLGLEPDPKRLYDSWIRYHFGLGYRFEVAMAGFRKSNAPLVTQVRQ